MNMKEIIEKIKSKLWFITIPVAALVLFSMSALKDIEASHQELETGKKLSYYLRTSTDSLTYLAIAYTSTKDAKFLDQFNEHLERRKYKQIDVDPEFQIYYNEGLRLSNELATKIEGPAFEKMDDQAFFSKEYIDYKTKIIASIDKLREETYKKSNDKLSRALLEINIYIYSLILIILAFIILIRFEPKEEAPVKKVAKPRAKAKLTPVKKAPIKKAIVKKSTKKKI
jgi:hypothetical protein